LKEGGLLILTGLANVTSIFGYIGYGVAKAGVHNLVRSLASTGSGLPKDAKVICLSPTTIDSESSAPDLVPLNALTQKLYNWATGANPVAHGKIVEVTTKNGQTTWEEL